MAQTMEHATDHATLAQSIADEFPKLSPQLQRAARHVLDCPEDVALLSMRRLAGKAGVQPSTMVRLARNFHFESFRDFREPFQQRLRGRPGGYLDRARGLQARGRDEHEAAGLLRDLVATDMVNLQGTFDANGPERLAACAKRLARARRVFILGLRSCYPVAFAFHYSYRMFRDNGVLLDGQGGAFSDDLRAFSADDVIIAISFEPYSRETVQAVAYAKARGGDVVALTDSVVSPLAEQADDVLLLTLESPSFFPSVTSAVSLAQSLLAVMVAEGGQAALDAIDESERQLEMFSAYWEHPAQRGRQEPRDAIPAKRQPRRKDSARR